MKYPANAAAGADTRLRVPPDIQATDGDLPTASEVASLQEAWVINLKRRPDRLRDFHHRLSSLRPLMNLQRFDAIDGQQLEMCALASRVNPWWREVLPHHEFKGHLAVALSHLAVWDLAGRSSAPLVLVFEDDAAFARRGCASRLMAALRAAPSDADLIWLNVDIRPRERGNRRWLFRRFLRNCPSVIATFPRTPILEPLLRRELFWRWTGDFLKTTEAYLITPAFARVLHNRICNDLGPMDISIRDWIGRLNTRAYELRVPIFRQADWSDSDRDLTGKSVIGHPPARS